MAIPSAGSGTSRLSVVVLATHGQDPLEATLQSLVACQAGTANAQTIVMDCAESSRIADICRNHGVDRLTPAAELDLSAAWNEALASADSDWVLCLEAGETISAESLQSIVEFVKHEADPAAAYVAMVEIPSSLGQVCEEQAAQARLIPHLDSIYFVGRVHPSLLPAIAQAGLDLRHFGARIVRGPREYSQTLRTLRAHRDIQLAQRQLTTEGESAELLVAWGEALSVLGQHSEAYEVFKRAVPLAAKGSTTLLESYYGLLSSLDHQPAAREDQLNACLEALDAFPLDAQLLCGMGSYMLAQNRPDLAVRAYSIAVGHGQVDPQSWHLAEISAVAASCLSLTQQLMGDEAAARETLEVSLTRFPESIRLRRQLLNILIKQGAADAAMTEFNRLPATLPMREALRCAVRGALLAGQKNWMAALPYLQTAYTAGCRDVICLRWLSVVLISTGDFAAARPILLDWQQIEPQNAELQSYLVSLAEIQPEQPETIPSVNVPSTDTSKKIRIDTRKSAEPALRTRTDRALPKLESAFDRDLPDSPASV